MVQSKILVVLVTALAAVLTISAMLAYNLSRDRDTRPIGVSLTGLVDSEVTLTLDDLKARANASVVAELICVSGQSFGTHTWTGVKLKDLLNEAGVRADTFKVAFFAADGYSTDLTINDAMRDDVIIALQKDGAPLDEDTQLVVPGKWGYKWITGIVSIELVDSDFKGTWESMGYSDDANIRMLRPDQGSSKAP